MLNLGGGSWWKITRKLLNLETNVSNLLQINIYTETMACNIPLLHFDHLCQTTRQVRIALITQYMKRLVSFPATLNYVLWTCLEGKRSG